MPGYNKGGTHATDKTSSDVPKAMRMAGATWIALNNYDREKKCGCQGKFDPSWWNQITDFVKYSLPPLKMHLEGIEESQNLPYLERKLIPLNVPMR